MTNTHTKTLKLAQMAILIALLAVLTFTPLGFIMVPPVSITLMHIPVIIGAVMMGPVEGGILGLAFGIFSMIKASTAAVSPVDMAFSPFLSDNPVASVVLCILPRILLGVIAGGLYLSTKYALLKGLKRDVLATGVTAVAASFCHTALVMGLLWGLFRALPLRNVLLTIVSVNSVLEMLAAAVLVTAVCKPLKHVLQR